MAGSPGADPHTPSNLRKEDPMGKYILIATSAATEGQEAEFDRWYDEVHLPQGCAIPGIQSARRFAASPASPMPVPAPVVAVYEIETDDPAGVMADLLRRAGGGELTMSGALDG